MKWFLVPTDFSDTATNALVYAFKLAEKVDARLLVYHVYHPAVIDVPVAPNVVADAVVQDESWLEEQLDEQIAEARQISGVKEVPAEKKLQAGLLVEATLELSAEISPEMIIMGTKGASGWREIFGGSNTGRIIEDVNVPVLAIPECAFYASIRHIAYSSELKPGDRNVLNRLLEFAGWFNACIHAFHVHDSDKEQEEEVLNELRSEYAEYVQEAQLTFEIIDSEGVMKGIQEYVKTHNIDLLAMLTKKRGFWEKIFKTSHTKHMAYSSHLPLLVYHG